MKKKDYAAFNAALDRLMKSGSFTQQSLKASTAAENAYKDNNENHRGSYGSLILQVSEANGALPVKGAKVTIEQKDGTVINEQKTNISGKTESIKLYAPLAEYSQSPSGGVPYSTYNITVEKNGYYTREFLNIPVFSGIESIQSVVLEPLGENALPNDMIITDEEFAEILSNDEKGAK